MNDVESAINLFLEADNYKKMFDKDVQSVIEYILPAIKLGQYRVFRQGNVPFAYTSWAFMNKSSSDIFKKTGTIEDDAWWNNKDVTPMFDGDGCRSTSAGDYVLVGNTKYLCDAMGWSKIT